MERDPRVRVLASVVVASGRIFEVRDEHIALPSGLEQRLFVIDHPGAVGIAPIRDDGRVVLVRQYRHAIARWLTEIPAGRLERGESPERAAQRELEEETGLRARELLPLGVLYPAPGFCSERMHLFAARGLTEVLGERARQDPDEELERLELAPSEALAAVAEDAKSWIAVMRALARSAP